MRLFHAPIETPIGEMFALATDSSLCVLEFGTLARRGRLNGRLQKWFPPHEIRAGESAATRATREWLQKYFDGVSADGAELPLVLYGAPFEMRVWQSLRRIPAGETRTYGSIARALGSAGASRAVGIANGANPLAIVVPCHRVIGSDGTLTGYGGGLEKKSWLLKHETRWAPSALLPLMDLMSDAQA
jgi:O-6-methylguanine DNA methyltransferase